MNHKKHILPLVMISYLIGYMDTPILKRSRANDDRGERTIPMRLELEIESDIYVVGENFPIRLRMVNPNPFDVSLRGFEFGYDRPRLELSIPGEDEFRAFPRGAHNSAMRRMPVTIPANSAIERHRVLYRNFARDQWFMPPGRYRLRGTSDLSAVRVEGHDGRWRVDWTSQVATFILRMPTGRERQALEFLRERWSDFHHNLSRLEPGFDPTNDSLKIRRDFLERYEDSLYAPEIRWEIAKLLPNEILDQWSPLHDNPEMVDLFEQCLTFCLDQGGAYAEELLRWDMDKGGNRSLRLASKYKRFDLLKRIVKELDQKYPGDAEASLFRRFVVVRETESIEAARRVAETLREQFPEGKYTKRAADNLFWLDHRESGKHRAESSPRN